MNQVFRIETDRFCFTWDRVSDHDPQVICRQNPQGGRLVFNVRHQGDTFSAIALGKTTSVASGSTIIDSPLLFEQTDYEIFARAKSPHQSIQVSHPDPVLSRSLKEQEGGRIHYGRINFRSQVGKSRFSLIVDGVPELDFEVEIFPSKLDYEVDYKELLNDVREILSGLAFEYLKSTFQLGVALEVQNPTRLEWFKLLGHVIERLERAINHIANRPLRGLRRDPEILRIESIRRVDSPVLSEIRRGKGRGSLCMLATGQQVREKIAAKQARLTLDTPEHRWLSQQLADIRRTLGRLYREEASSESSESREEALKAIKDFEIRISRLSRVEPLIAVNGIPPPGFASLQLLSSPGYGEAYRCCMILRLGLQIEGEPISLSVKDLNLLYEYWCYLATVKEARLDRTCSLSLDKLFSVHRQGLRVALRKGREQSVDLEDDLGNRIRIIYNPLFHSFPVLVPQRPDILISIEEKAGEVKHLIVDAKYRIDASDDYLKRYLSYGPPEAALNSLHRYRDAIIERSKSDPRQPFRRNVSQAVALFPLGEIPDLPFAESRLWKALMEIGVGAIPMLPGNLYYFRQWLNAVLRE